MERISDERRCSAFTPESVQIVSGLILLFLSFAAIALYIIRRKFMPRRNSLVKAFIDCMISFIGGGNLRIQHKWKRLFFGTLFCGAFFYRVNIYKRSFKQYALRS